MFITAQDFRKIILFPGEPLAEHDSRLPPPTWFLHKISVGITDRNMISIRNNSSFDDSLKIWSNIKKEKLMESDPVRLHLHHIVRYITLTTISDEGVMSFKGFFQYLWQIFTYIYFWYIIYKNYVVFNFNLRRNPLTTIDKVWRISSGAMWSKFIYVHVWYNENKRSIFH